MKKCIKCGLAAVAAVCLLAGAGCAKGETDPATSNEGETTVTTTVSTSAQPTTMTDAPTTTTAPAPQVLGVKDIIFASDELVPIVDHIPDVEVELRYATENNFTGKVIYDFDEAYLRYSTVQKLKGVQETLKEQGYRLLIWDAYRPPAAQFVLWEVVSDPQYVADPNDGYSLHSNGGTVDLSMVTLDGGDVSMPSAFDEFDSIANRDYSDDTEEVRTHALVLEEAMQEAGFSPYYNEWWHYSDEDWFPYEDLSTVKIPTSAERERVLTKELPVYWELMEGGEASVTLQAGDTVRVVGYSGSYVHVAYENGHGYVKSDDLA